MPNRERKNLDRIVARSGVICLIMRVANCLRNVTTSGKSFAAGVV